MASRHKWSYLKLIHKTLKDVGAYIFYSDVCILPSDYTGSLVPWYTVTKNFSAEKYQRLKTTFKFLILSLLKRKLFTYYKKLEWLWKLNLFILIIIFLSVLGRRWAQGSRLTYIGSNPPTHISAQMCTEV